VLSDNSRAPSLIAFMASTASGSSSGRLGAVERGRPVRQATRPRSESEPKLHACRLHYALVLKLRIPLSHDSTALESGGRLMVADWSGTLLEWKAELRHLKERMGSKFGRAETREMAARLLMVCLRARNARPVG
jgi:hypothetical protein